MFVLRVWDNLRFLWFNTPIAFPLPANRGQEVLLLQLNFACDIRELAAIKQTSGAPFSQNLSLVFIL